MFCCLCETIGYKGEGSVLDSVTTKITSGWSNFRYLNPLLASRVLPLRAESRLRSAHPHSITMRLGQLKRKM